MMKPLNTTTTTKNKEAIQAIPRIQMNSILTTTPPLILPAFDLSSSTVSYGNGKLRVKTTAFEVKCHPDYAKILKTVLTRSFLNTDQNNYDNIQFVPYGLAQVAGEQVYKQQIVKQNAFLHNLAIIPVHNIDSDIMYSKIIPLSRKIGSIKGFEPTFLSDTR